MKLLNEKKKRKQTRGTLDVICSTEKILKMLEKRIITWAVLLTNFQM